MATASARISPDRNPSVLNRVPEDDEIEELDEEEILEEQGFYRGDYRQLVALYTLAPLTSVVGLALLAALPYVAYHLRDGHPSTYPYLAILPFPLPELVASAGLYCLTYLLRGPFYAVPAFIIPFPQTAALISTTLYTLLSIFARFAVLALLLVRQYAAHPFPTWHDHAFFRVWWVALGWAAADAAISVYQGYAGLAVYRDVLIPSCDPPSDPECTPLLPSRPAAPLDPEIEVENDIEQLVALKAREDLEDTYGVPLIHIPAFIPCLQRINAILLSIGLFLLLGAAIYPGRGSRPWVLGTLATATHLLLAVLHAPFVLPRVGVQNAAYVGAIVSLGAIFAGLGVWGGIS
ncbi:hypothetical protein FB45DRAFT_1067797 [Roridomyces roridus]|uniref:Uncharacterized protein n=1 Tax=Roridomyces roridus TaxID=1738132 RepID=A0AAD7B148_9AGAR|nr:hypothetical protein FB45DRAFT_1067797 [Roridomyces roridus]